MRSTGNSSKAEMRGVFVLNRNQSTPENPDITVFGYIKPEDDHWIAVCVNLDLLAQGRSDDEALIKLIESMESYIRFVQAEYPNKWQKVLDSIECSQDSLEEYKNIALQMVNLAECKPTAAQPQFKPSTAFVKTVPAAYAH